MNYWTELSIEYANQRSYLDDLYSVYPTIPDGIRTINENKWNDVVTSFQQKDNIELVKNLLRLEKFPFKDSYVDFLRKDITSFQKNPQTINRLAGMAYSVGIEKLFEKSSEPKETNTQMGGKFSNWINKGSIGILPVSETEFLASNENAILAGGDKKLSAFAKKHFEYNKLKGLDFVARFNKKFILGEAKFISAVGNKQSDAFKDVISTLTTNVEGALIIGIVDGVVWLKKRNPYYKQIITTYENYYIMSSLVLRKFLYQI